MGREDFRRIKSRSYTRSCPRKNAAGQSYRRFPTRSHAFNEFLRLEEKMKRQGLAPPRDIYQCHLCFGWHISTQGLSKGGENHNGSRQEEGRQQNQGCREEEGEREVR